MKNLVYLTLALLLFVTACRDEQIISEDPIIIQDPPKEVEGAFFSGQLTDTQGQAVSGLIKIYQSGALQGEVIADENGNYNTLEVPLEVGAEVTFAIEEEDYMEKYKRKFYD